MACQDDFGDDQVRVSLSEDGGYVYVCTSYNENGVATLKTEMAEINQFVPACPTTYDTDVYSKTYNNQ